MDSCDDNYDHSSWKIIHGDSFDKNSEYYDVTQQFLDTFQSLTLDTFHGLKSAVKRLSEGTGYVYTIKRSKRYRDSDRRREHLVYSHVSYGCTLHVPGSSSCSKQSEFPCPSMINFTSVKGHFKVAKFDMIHNHAAPMPCPRLEIDPSVFPAFIDCGDSFREAFPNMSAGSYTEFTNRLKGFEKATGSVFIKYSSGLFGNTGDRQQALCRYKKLRYVCIHYGTRRSEPILRRNQHTTKIGCGACFSVKYAEGRLHIINYDMRHCHPVDPESAMLYPCNRRLSAGETAEIEELFDYNPDIEALKMHIKQKYGKVCTTRDIINMRFRRKKRLEGSVTKPTGQMNLLQDIDGDGDDDDHDEDDEDEELVPYAPQHQLTPTPVSSSNLNSLVDICCQQQSQQPQDSKQHPSPPRLTPVLREIHAIAAAAPLEEAVGYHTVLRQLADAWRRGGRPVVAFPKDEEPSGLDDGDDGDDDEEILSHG